MTQTPEATQPPSALDAALEKTRATELPDPGDCLEVSRAYLELGDYREAARWCSRVVQLGLDYRAWDAAARLLKRFHGEYAGLAKRQVRMAVIGSYTTDQLVDLLRLAGVDREIYLDIYEAGYGQYQQEVLDPDSGLYRHEPDLVLIAVHEGELRLPDHTTEPDLAASEEVDRWVSMWSTIQERTNARVIQTNFVPRPEDAFGHLSARLAGTRASLVKAVNIRLGQAAGNEVSILDCERLASLQGRDNWFDDRYWFRSKQAVGFDALPLLARELSAVVAAELGLSKKCLVLDLDGTVWGGVIGEDGLEGIRLGHGIDGEAFSAFQKYVLALKDRGVILAVCSKNDEHTAKEAFESHPDMQLTLDDFAAFYANWEPKPDNIRRIAEALDIGLDALTFVDDQPAERELVRQTLPEVDVITLPSDPAHYVNTMAHYPYFEPAAFTEEDARRTETYRARGAAFALKEQSTSLKDFLEGLEMEATFGPFDDFHMSRVSQLVGKTNQFNLTTRRHGRAQLEAMTEDPNVVHFYVKLRDRFADHGLIGVVIGSQQDDVMEIDTLLMSCRVIGRTVERAMVGELMKRSRDRGCRSVIGSYVKTKRNGLVVDLYESLGFEKLSEDADGSTWRFDLESTPVTSEFIQMEVL